MGLRLEEGVDLARISSLSGVATDALVDSAAVERLSALGLITCEGGRLGVLPPGMLLLDAILPEIVAYRRKSKASATPPPSVLLPLSNCHCAARRWSVFPSSQARLRSSPPPSP